MPNGNDPIEIPLSQIINETRALLLQTLQAQLDELLAAELVPQLKGVPFVDFANDPPQIATLKKVINCLYHAEQGFKHLERVDKNSAWGYIKGAKPIVEALIQVYKALAMLDEASPEIRKVIADNYRLLEPMFLRANQLVQESGWMSQFLSMRVTDKASKIMLQGMELLGPNQDQLNHSNPVVSSFSALSRLIETVSLLQDKDHSSDDDDKMFELVHGLLHDLEHNAFITKWQLSDLENAKAIQDLLAWFQNIEDDGYHFTKTNIQQYISWANHYLPALVSYADQLEQQNYLKPGLLSSSLVAQIEKLSQQANTLLSESDWPISERVISTEGLTAYQEEQTNLRQTQCVQAIVVAEKQQEAAAQFYQILHQYQGMSFDSIAESDRILLRKLYPKIQMEIAYTNLELENQFANVLNKPGPENRPSPKKWWQNGLGYVAAYVMSPQVDKLLKTEPEVIQLSNEQIAAETFKLTVAERSRHQFGGQHDIIQKTELENKVNQRIQQIKSELKKEPEPLEIQTRILPVKAEHLTNLRGTLTVIQKMQLSNRCRPRKVEDRGL